MGPFDVMGKAKNYLRYSGVDIMIKLNPFGWTYIPRVERYPRYLDEMFNYGDNFKGFSVAFLGFKIYFWVDDGYDGF